MAKRRAKRTIGPSHFHHDLVMMATGFVFAFFFSVVVFEIFNAHFHWIGEGSVSSGGAQQVSGINETVHGAASQSMQQTASELLVSAEKSGPAYAVPGQKHVTLMKFSLSPSNTGFVTSMSFDLDKLAHPYDLQSLQLFYGDEQLGDVSFFEGKGSFKNLMIKVEANRLMEFTLTGTVSGQAQIGDRLITKFASDLGIVANDNNGFDFSVLGTDTASGPATSIVHGP